MCLLMLAAYAMSMALTANAMCTTNSCGMNGYCSANLCKCRHGFTKDPNGRCIPFVRCASDRCQSGFCSPITFMCTCWDGYFMDPNGNCVKTEACTIDSCTNGVCSNDGECYCKEGFFKGPNSHCIAIGQCSPQTCTNGHCDPVTQQCKCKPGFVKSIHGQCVGFGSCQLTCQNGQCAKLLNMQEVCYCNQGFQRDAKKPNTCTKIAAGAGEQEIEREGEAKITTTTTAPVPPPYNNIGGQPMPQPLTPPGPFSINPRFGSRPDNNLGNNRLSGRSFFNPYGSNSFERRIYALILRMANIGRMLEALS